MKIGILTFHCANNYGAVLQCYALYKFLEELGHNVYIIDYRPKYLTEPYKVFSFYWFKSPIYPKIILKKILHCTDSFYRNKFFNNFINRLKISDLDLNSPNNDFDAFIFGSDQIWNTKLCKGIDNTFFANKPAFRNKINIAYAASVGNCKIADSDYNEIQNLLNRNFTKISTREKSLTQKLAQIGISSLTVLDPTLLAGKKIFDNIVQKPKEDKYVLIYQVYHDKRSLQIAQYISKKEGIPIIEISSNAFGEGRKRISPEQFIGYFKYAQYIITTSFHGTIFSIIYNRTFYTLSINPILDSRSQSILNILGLSNHLINNISQIDLLPIDYTIINDKLEKEQSLSKQFLINALENYNHVSK